MLAQQSTDFSSRSPCNAGSLALARIPLAARAIGEPLGKLLPLAATGASPGSRTKQIENVEVGDLVWAWDEIAGKLVKRPVKRLFRHKAKPIVAVTIADDEGSPQVIEATTEHPFWIAGRGWEGWVAASELREGDLLKRIGAGSTVRVVSVRCTGTKADVFNFEVEDTHNYFVGTHGVLVHNQSKYDFDHSLETKNNIVAVRSKKYTQAQMEELDLGFENLSSAPNQFPGKVVLVSHADRTSFGGSDGARIAGAAISDVAIGAGGKGKPIVVVGCAVGESKHPHVDGKPIIRPYDTSIAYEVLKDGNHPYLIAFKTQARIDDSGRVLGGIETKDAKKWSKKYGEDSLVPEYTYELTTDKPRQYVGVTYQSARRVFLPVLSPEAVARIEGTATSSSPHGAITQFNQGILNSEYGAAQRGRRAEFGGGKIAITVGGQVSLVDGRIVKFGSFTDPTYNGLNEARAIGQFHIREESQFELPPSLDWSESSSAAPSFKPPPPTFQMWTDRSIPSDLARPLQLAYVGFVVPRVR